MQRRQFIKTIAAAASAPLMPANMLNASPLGTGIYTKAVGLTQSSACLSSSFLKNTLGLDDSKLKILVSRLETDGLVGQAGNSGLLFSKNCFPTRSILPLPPAQVLTQNEASPPPKARAQKIKDTSPKKLDFAQDIAKSDLPLTAGVRIFQSIRKTDQRKRIDGRGPS